MCYVEVDLVWFVVVIGVVGRLHLVFVVDLVCCVRGEHVLC